MLACVATVSGLTVLFFPLLLLLSIYIDIHPVGHDACSSPPLALSSRGHTAPPDDPTRGATTLQTVALGAQRPSKQSSPYAPPRMATLRRCARHPCVRRSTPSQPPHWCRPLSTAIPDTCRPPPSPLGRPRPAAGPSLPRPPSPRPSRRGSPCGRPHCGRRAPPRATSPARRRSPDKACPTPLLSAIDRSNATSHRHARPLAQLPPTPRDHKKAPPPRPHRAPAQTHGCLAQSPIARLTARLA